VQHPKEAAKKPNKGGPIIVDVTQPAIERSASREVTQPRPTLKRPEDASKRASVEREVALKKMLKRPIPTGMTLTKTGLLNTMHANSRIQDKKDAWKMLALVSKHAHTKRQMQGGGGWPDNPKVNLGERVTLKAIRGVSSTSDNDDPTSSQMTEDELLGPPPELEQSRNLPRFELNNSTPNGSSISFESIEDMNFEDILLGD
jgi:hypothetical protein